MAYQHKQIYGRKKITTSYRFNGNAEDEIATAKQILKEAIPLHEENAKEETRLWDIYVNSADTWEKVKTQREDINNKVTIANAWAFSRTINSYIFGEPVQYTERKNGKQQLIEKLSQYLDYACNQNATTNATLSASICGLGYKLVLASTDEEYAETGCPFNICGDMIMPQNAFMVYTDSSIPKKVMGVYITTYKDALTGEEYEKYNCWTNNFYMEFINKGKYAGEDYIPLPQNYGSGLVYAYPIVSKKIALVEVERNALRKGDWEVAVDLMELLDKLTSDRIDDIDQIIDYILVLTNCNFKDNGERDSILKERVLELEVGNPQVKPTVEILKNAIEQTGVQGFVDYVESKLIEIIGVPSRAERNGGGHDTGVAVKYRNGFRDLENNAGLIIPKFEQAELEFLSNCIAYSKVYPETGIGDLKPYEIRLKFLRTLNDDIVSSATAYSTYVNAGMDFETALHLSKGVSDPAETNKKIVNAFKNNETFIQLKNDTETTTEKKSVVKTKGSGDNKTETNA